MLLISCGESKSISLDSNDVSHESDADAVNVVSNFDVSQENGDEVGRNRVKRECGKADRAHGRCHYTYYRYVKGTLNSVLADQFSRLVVMAKCHWLKWRNC